MIVNRHTQGVIARLATGLRHIARHPVARSVEARQLLGVQTQEFARRLAFIAVLGGAPLAAAAIWRTRLGADASHVGSRDAYTTGDDGIGQAMVLAQADDALAFVG
ncbi:MAG: hypothetical protein Q8L87_09245 [Anaerolineales bacterium]|nr:hypothetical protein [Anaerolineales bacterium]